VLALVITAVTGLAVAGVSMALSVASGHGEDSFRAVQAGRSAARRISNTVRKAKLVTAATADAVAIWAGDGNGNGRINLSEMTVVEHHAGDKELKEYKVVFPDTMDEPTRSALDVELSLSSVTDVAGAKQQLGSSAYCRTFILAADVHDFRVGASPAAPRTVLLWFELTVGRGRYELTVRSAAAPRASAVDSVGVSGDEYVLN